MTVRETDPPNPDFAETTRRFLTEMPISKHFGFAVTGVGPGLFEITQPFRKELSFRPGIFQAGPVGTLADMAAACAGMTMLPCGWAASTVDYTIKLIAPAAGDKIVHMRLDPDRAQSRTQDAQRKHPRRNPGGTAAATRDREVSRRP